MLIKSNFFQVALLIVGILWQALIAFLLHNRVPVYLSILGDEINTLSHISKFLLLYYQWVALLPIFSLVVIYILYKQKASKAAGYITILMALIYNLLVYKYILALFYN